MNLGLVSDGGYVDIEDVQLFVRTASNEAILYCSLILSDGLDNDIVHVVVTHLGVFKAVGKDLGVGIYIIADGLAPPALPS